MRERPVFTVSELTLADQGTPRGGASRRSGSRARSRTCARPRSGHVYFTLKDEAAQLRCVLFRGRGRRVRFEPEDGLQVLAFGGLDVYAARGEYQLVVELLEPKGRGRAPARLRAAQGAGSRPRGSSTPARKRPLPPFPRRIGIVTSPTGAALRDILHVIGAPLRATCAS